MTINVGDTIPSATLKHAGPDGIGDLNTDDLLKSGKVILFGVPGAFTGTCHKVHVPSYLNNYDALKAKGVDRIVCVAVNDPFVIAAWAEASGATGKIDIIGDWDASFVKSMGLDQQIDVIGLGVRSKRFSILLEDGVVKSLDIEEGKGVTVSGGEACLARLG